MTRKPHKNFARTALVHGFAGTLLAISAPSVIAQEVNEAIQKRKQEQETEVIEVTGVRASLENALNVKREAPSIVDAISANDIDALPALDLGEALQALPGIQLNSDDEGRQSTISLRGLSSGFVKTTAFGQSFATPSNGQGNVGSSNPFSAFEAGIFDGVTVVKSPTADMQEGGLAGTVDKKLQQALSKKDGIAAISIGARYEELAESYNPNIKFSAVKHLIEDKLGVAVKFSSSKQEFRRDTFDVVDYIDINYDPRTRNYMDRAENVDRYMAEWANIIPQGEGEARLRVPYRGRNVSQYSDGDRMSLAGNIEYRVSDDFKVGAHLLMSNRDLDNGTKETTNMQAGLHRTRADRDYANSNIMLDLDAAPIAYEPFANEDGTEGVAFIAPSYSFENGTYQIENRKTTFNEKTKGIILYGEYLADDWVIDGKATASKAENNFENIGINFVHNGDHVASRAGSGFSASIHQGYGDPSQIKVAGGFETPYVYDGIAWQTGADQDIYGPYGNATASSVTSRDELNQGRRLNHGINGRVKDLTKDYNSIEFNAQRYTDFGLGDVLRFDSVKFGGRFSQEKLETTDQRNSFVGVDTRNISSAYISTENVLSAQQTPFFNGKIPNTFDHTSGWVTINNEQAIATLQQGIITDRNLLPLPNHPRNRLENGVYEGLERNRSGFWDSMSHSIDLPTQLGFNFEAEQNLTAAYITSDFSGDLPLNISYRGNIGVRHVETDNTFWGFATGRNEDGSPFAELQQFEDDYSNTLPMANISFDITDDIVLRTAYYEGIVRPNLLSQRPTPSFTENSNSIRVGLPTATLKPYEADNYDISLEWYNREGSAISIGYFSKTISNLFDSNPVEGYCPSDGSDAIVNGFIPNGIERIDAGTEILCVTNELFQRFLDDGVTPDGDPFQKEVNINLTLNNDEELKVEGWELAVQQKLDFLPYPWNGFGGVFNYTKLEQSGSELELNRVSPESFNIIAYWENDGFSARFTYNWRDDQTLRGANSFLGTGIRTQKARSRLDFSGSYKVNKKVKVFFQAFNLTDEVNKQFYGSDERALHSLAYPGRQYKVSVNYRF